MKKKVLFSIALCAFLPVLLFFLKSFFLPDNTRLCYLCKNFTELKMTNNKEVPPELINSFVFAQSYFPELNEVFISVQFTSISSTMWSMPSSPQPLAAKLRDRCSTWGRRRSSTCATWPRTLRRSTCPTTHHSPPCSSWL